MGAPEAVSSGPDETGHSAWIGRSGSGGKRLDAGREAGELAADRVAGNHTLASCTLHLRLGRTECFCRCILVAGQDGLLNILDEGTHTGQAGSVAQTAALVLTDAFTGRCVVCHGLQVSCG